MLCVFRHFGTFLVSFLAFMTLRTASYHFHEEPKWAKLLWQLPSHVLCTSVGYWCYVNFVRDEFDETILVPDKNILSSEYAFFWGFWLTVVIDFYVDRFSRDKDRLIMLCHHIATFCALISSDLLGLRRIGLYVLVLHDCSDILIMGLKIAYRSHVDTVYLTSIYLMALLTWLCTRIWLFGELYLCYILPIFYVEVKHNLFYTLPVLALTILFVCNIMWTRMIIGYGLRSTHDVVQDYEGAKGHN